MHPRDFKPENTVPSKPENIPTKKRKERDDIYVPPGHTLMTTGDTNLIIPDLYKNEARSLRKLLLDRKRHHLKRSLQEGKELNLEIKNTSEVRKLQDRLPPHLSQQIMEACLQSPYIPLQARLKLKDAGYSPAEANEIFSSTIKAHLAAGTASNSPSPNVPGTLPDVSLPAPLRVFSSDQIAKAAQAAIKSPELELDSDSDKKASNSPVFKSPDSLLAREDIPEIKHSSVTDINIFGFGAPLAVTIAETKAMETSPTSAPTAVPAPTVPVPVAMPVPSLGAVPGVVSSVPTLGHDLSQRSSTQPQESGLVSLVAPCIKYPSQWSFHPGFGLLPGMGIFGYPSIVLPPSPLVTSVQSVPTVPLIPSPIRPVDASGIRSVVGSSAPHETLKTGSVKIGGGIFKKTATIAKGGSIPGSSLANLASDRTVRLAEPPAPTLSTGGRSFTK